MNMLEIVDNLDNCDNFDDCDNCWPLKKYLRAQKHHALTDSLSVQQTMPQDAISSSRTPKRWIGK